MIRCIANSAIQSFLTVGRQNDDRILIKGVLRISDISILQTSYLGNSCVGKTDSSMKLHMFTKDIFRISKLDK